VARVPQNLPGERARARARAKFRVRIRVRIWVRSWVRVRVRVRVGLRVRGCPIHLTLNASSTPNPEQVIDQMNGKEKAREMGSVSAPSKQEPAAELAAAA